MRPSAAPSRRVVSSLWLLGVALMLGASSASAQRLYWPRACHPVAYHTVPRLRAQRVCMNLRVTTHGTQPGTYLFMTPGGAFATGAGIFNDDGSLVWWHHATTPMDDDISVVQYRGHRYMAIWSGRAAFGGPLGAGTVSLYNQHYQRVGTITSGPPFGPDRIDAHEFRITPQGDALFGIYVPVATKFRGRPIKVYKYVVQKVSLASGSHGIHTGRVLFQWDSLSHVPLSQSRIAPPKHHQTWDYFHGNAIDQTPDGNLVVSSRNTWGIYKINIQTGQTMWQVGAKGDRSLPSPWSWQHDVVPLGGDRYSLFDDGNVVIDQGERSAHPSRGLIVRVNAGKRPATVQLLHAYTHSPEISSGYCGSVQRVSNDDVLIDWGQTPEITEYGQGGGSPLMDLSMSQWSCRGQRFAWRGDPLTRPAAAALLSGTDTKVWASWNGSTEVHAWRVLAGPTAGQLSSVSSPSIKDGFETEIVLPQPYKVVAVQALGASGRVLSTSKPVAATS